MTKPQSAELPKDGPPPNTSNQHQPESKPEAPKLPHITNLMRKLTSKGKTSPPKDPPPPKPHASPEETLAAFKSRNPELYPPSPREQQPKNASLEIPEPIVRARSLSKGQREMERLENPLITDPTPVEEMEAKEKAKETMRQGKGQRFQKFLEEYL